MKHVVCDNYATRKTPEVNAWLEKHPRITLHFTPTSGSRLNMVEIFFGIITRQAIRRGTFRSVHELTDAIRRFIDTYNDRAQPFTWAKTADQILAHARPASPGARCPAPSAGRPAALRGRGVGFSPVRRWVGVRPADRCGVASFPVQGEQAPNPHQDLRQSPENVGPCSV